MMLNNQGDSHFYAVIAASEAACELINILPDTDLIAELGLLLETQLDLFAHMLQGKHYGTDELTEFLIFCQDVIKQAERIQEKLI